MTPTSIDRSHEARVNWVDRMIRLIFFLPVESQLQCNLYVGIWAHFVLLDELFSVVVELVDMHVQIIHQSGEEKIKFA